MGEISRALGEGSVLRFKGKDYKLSPWSYGIQGQFEQYLEQKAWETCRRAAAHLSPEEHAELRAQTSRDITAGVYTFGQQVSATALKALPHLRQLIYLMLETNHPEVTPADVQAMIDSDLDEVITKMNEANADPFAATPAAASP